MQSNIDELVAESREVVREALERYSPAIALACSFSPEDILVFSLMREVSPSARLFALDTGRLNPETYECAEEVRRRFGAKIEWYFPVTSSVEALEREKGLMSFRESIDNRRECCRIRKVEPLARALSGLKAWVTGLRKGQGVTRESLSFVEQDEAHGIAKINPLVNWDYWSVLDYVRRERLPYNRLLDAGYKSIGCAPCTRAVSDGEDERAGRWWWESPDHKECGLHMNRTHGAGI